MIDNEDMARAILAILREGLNGTEQIYCDDTESRERYSAVCAGLFHSVAVSLADDIIKSPELTKIYAQTISDCLSGNYDDE
jgi:hypothetical protein